MRLLGGAAGWWPAPLATPPQLAGPKHPATTRPSLSPDRPPTPHAELGGAPTEARVAALVTLACRGPLGGPPAGPDPWRASIHPDRGERLRDWGRAGAPWDAKWSNPRPGPAACPGCHQQERPGGGLTRHEPVPAT